MTQGYHQITPVADRRGATLRSRVHTLPEERRRALVHPLKAIRVAHSFAATMPADVRRWCNQRVLIATAAPQTKCSAVRLTINARCRDLLRRQSIPDRCSRLS